MTCALGPGTGSPELGDDDDDDDGPLAEEGVGVGVEEVGGTGPGPGAGTGEEGHVGASGGADGEKEGIGPWDDDDDGVTTETGVGEGEGEEEGGPYGSGGPLTNRRGLAASSTPEHRPQMRAARRCVTLEFDPGGCNKAGSATSAETQEARAGVRSAAPFPKRSVAR